MPSRLRAIPAGVLLVAAGTFGLLAVLAVLGRAFGGPPEVPLPERIPRPPDYAKPLGAALSLGPAREDEAYLDAFLRTFTSLTPENAMKWEVVHPARGRWNFDEADALVDAAVRTRKRVRGHPLVWDQQLPPYAARGDVETMLREHVRTLVRRYRGRVAQWDVVNEPLEDDGTLTQNPWQRTLGERWIDVAFATARAADPEAQLFLNEIGAERGVKFSALVALARRLRDRGVPIDGIGLQNHTTSGNFPSREVLAEDLAAIGKLGLEAEITEMDVEGASPRAYAAAARACADAPNCTGLTVWGVTDRWSWIGEDKRALPFDAAGRAKPALRALTGPLRRR